jgi:FkbM family methyltransferase
MKNIKNFIPKKWNLPLRFYQNLIMNKIDFEVFWIKKQFKHCGGKRFIDVGANLGFYSYGLKGVFNSIVAFEPLESVSNFLRDSRVDNIIIYDVACSNVDGESEIHIPIIDKKIEYSYAGLDVNEKYKVFESRKIVTRRLDSFHFNDVDCIKIDVEGFEQNVIEGAYETIKRCLPIIVVELENRHRFEAIETMYGYLNTNFGYRGYFLRGKLEVSLEGSDFRALQRLDEFGKPILPYINNFIFRIER